MKKTESATAKHTPDNSVRSDPKAAYVTGNWSTSLALATVTNNAPRTSGHTVRAGAAVLTSKRK